MSFAPLSEPLRRVALFQGLQSAQISEIARRAERVVFNPGDIIIEEGVAGEAAYVIVSGKAARKTGPITNDPAETIGPGTLVGEMAMLVETSYSSTVVCQESVRALKITRTGLLAQMSSDLALADHMVDKLASRLRSLANDLRKVDDALASPRKFNPSMLASSVSAAFQSAISEARH